jgi:hypothetical protein
MATSFLEYEGKNEIQKLSYDDRDKRLIHCYFEIDFFLILNN